MKVKLTIEKKKEVDDMEIMQRVLENKCELCGAEKQGNLTAHYLWCENGKKEYQRNGHFKNE
jgi:hypothetical protein